MIFPRELISYPTWNKPFIPSLSPHWKMERKYFPVLKCAVAYCTGDWAEFTFEYLLIYSPPAKGRAVPGLALHLCPSLPSTHRSGISPSHGAAATDETLFVPCRIPLGSAPFQKEFSSPRRCSEDNSEAKVKCNSFAHPCDRNRGEGCFPIVVSSHSLVTVNPGTATFYALFLHIFLCLLYLFLFIPLISILRCLLSIPGLLQGDLCSCLKTYLAVGLCLNKSSQSSLIPSHTLQFCISG